MKRVLVPVLILLLLSCEELIPAAPEDDELLDGPTEGLSEAESLLFLAGDIAFNDEVFTTETGLGPLFVATSCGSCHAGDGKGHPFTTLTRFGQTQPNTAPDNSIGGPQL
ncbi:MAG: di-heme oxidoredictase family protein, partial [Cyclobacteriaceae bacterium]